VSSFPTTSTRSLRPSRSCWATPSFVVGSPAELAPSPPSGRGRTSWSSRRRFTGRRSSVLDLAIVGPDPGVAGGLLAQTEAPRTGAVGLGRNPELPYLRSRRLDGPRAGSPVRGPDVPPLLPGVDIVNVVAAATVIGRRVRDARTRFVCAATASSGFG